MKCLSSIFNFDTLKISAFIPKALCMCLCIVLAAELSARLLLHQGYLTPDRSLQKDIEYNLSFLKKNKPPVWLIGNSTLEFINTEGLNEIFRTTPVKITHGGATLSGSAAMLDFYLHAAPAPPDHIIIFTTKDDFNANGMNATTSKRYLELMTWQKYIRWNYSRLRSVRGAVYQKIMTVWSMLFVARNEIAAWDQTYRVLKMREIDPKKITLALMENYDFDIRGFSLAASICRSRGVQRISLVLLPISQPYALWHNRLFPHMQYNDIRKKIALSCELQNIRFIDLGTPLNKKYFTDFLHVNPAGSNYMQDVLAKTFFN